MATNQQDLRHTQTRSARHRRDAHYNIRRERQESLDFGSKSPILSQRVLQAIPQLGLQRAPASSRRDGQERRNVEEESPRQRNRRQKNKVERDGKSHGPSIIEKMVACSRGQRTNQRGALAHVVVGVQV